MSSGPLDDPTSGITPATRQPGGAVSADGVISEAPTRRAQSGSRTGSGAAAQATGEPGRPTAQSRATTRAAANRGRASEAGGISSGIIHRRVPFRVRRRLATGERLEVAQHEHSIVLVTPVLVVVGSLFVVYAVSSLTGYSTGVVSVLGLAWVGVVIWAALKWWEHEVQWLVITDKRVMRIDGIIERVAMLPLARLTDIAYERPLVGQIFGYGTFTLESAGQIQALREIKYIARPNKTHEKLTELLYRTEEKDNDGT